jgi:hypothetical protein
MKLNAICNSNEDNNQKIINLSGSNEEIDFGLSIFKFAQIIN